MPSIEVQQLASGPVSFNYTIATPVSNSAKKIDPKFPTVLFFHPVCIPQEVFTFQFGDPKIRQFNLVSVDMRCHGDTKGKVPNDFGQEMAAEDMARFMTEMKLPPCHIFALSLGTIVALQLAVSHPDKVLSLFLVSPLGLEEPQDVAEGRQAIHDAWVDGWRDGKPHLEELSFAVQGTLELAFYDRTLSISQAILALVLPACMRNWSASHLDEYRMTTLDIFLNRRPHPVEELRNIKVPVKLLHGMADVAYPLEYSQEFLQRLQDAGVDASLEAIEGASHFGCVEKYTIVNPIFHDFIIQQVEGPVPTLTKAVLSPWESALKKKGWVKEVNVLEDDSDEE
ncbi:alpha/beta-hydrolase [Rhodocollybia butyracea]|uniref:Alpha/beta-hydrolase n=1 Tax=Rhodocollybia butyracea TaxID=206335 RepID=A0A9P5PAG1_9AGAR|nr:alpha/beta-hydrolase [Rhodocollybia butyracea]KAF9061687.1 alpha/beta-hydrolase [Rhodocollybia butyracea]